MAEPYDYIDGKRVPQTRLDGDHSIDGKHHGSVSIHGGELTLTGELHGSLAVSSGSTALIVGSQHGSVSVAAGAKARVMGAINGSVSIGRGATVEIEPGGKLAGSLHNNGLMVVRGVFGGASSGQGQVRIEGDGYIKEPRVENGVHYYDWP